VLPIAPLGVRHPGCCPTCGGKAIRGHSSSSACATSSDEPHCELLERGGAPGPADTRPSAPPQLPCVCWRPFSRGPSCSGPPQVSGVQCWMARGLCPRPAWRKLRAWNRGRDDPPALSCWAGMADNQPPGVGRVLLSGHLHPLPWPAILCALGCGRCPAALARTERPGLRLAVQRQVSSAGGRPTCTACSPPLAGLDAFARSIMRAAWRSGPRSVETCWRCAPQPGDQPACWRLDQGVGRYLVLQIGTDSISTG